MNNHFEFGKLYKNPRFGGTWKVMSKTLACECTTLINIEKMNEDAYMEFMGQKLIRSVVPHSKFGQQFTEIETVTIPKDEYEKLLEFKGRLKGVIT